MAVSGLRHLASGLLLVSGLFGCSASPSHEPPAEPSVMSSEASLKLALSRRSLSHPIAQLSQLPAGVAGDNEVLIVGSPLEGRVLALSRLGGRALGELPAPPEGFILPFNMHQIGPRRVAVLDAGGLPSPSPFVPANPRIYEYSYTLTHSGGFHATLERTIQFDDQLIGFAEDIAVLGQGRYLLSDAVLGGIWVVESDGSVRPGIVPASSASSDEIPELRMCPTMPLISVGGVPFLFSGSTLPGVSPLAVRNGQVYFYSPCAEGLYSVPLASFFDQRAPHERAADIELVSPKPAGIQVEQLLGLAFNPAEPNEPWVYAADSLQLRIVRVHLKTGKRQVVADNAELFNFPSSTAFMPPFLGKSSLVVLSNQQHLTPLTNDAASEDTFDLPFTAAQVWLF